MSYTYTITFADTEVSKPLGHSEICDMFVPASAACNNEVFDETYYDTNVYGLDYGTELQDWMNAQITHPGIVAAMMVAVKEGTATWTTEDPNMEYFIADLNRVCADRGFTFEASDTDTEASDTDTEASDTDTDEDTDTDTDEDTDTDTGDDQGESTTTSL